MWLSLRASNEGLPSPLILHYPTLASENEGSTADPPLGVWPWGPSLRVSNEHILIVRVLRARRTLWPHPNLDRHSPQLSGASVISFTSPKLASTFDRASPEPTARIRNRSGLKWALAARWISSFVNFPTLARICWSQSFGRPSYSRSIRRLTMLDALVNEKTNEFT